jgi:hypothetical protein
VRLRPVLHAESEKLSDVIRRIDSGGYVLDTSKDGASKDAELSSLFFPDILSRDIAHHYPEYSEAKDRLRRSVDDHEKEFHEAALLVMKTLSLPRVAEGQRLGIALSFLEKCLEKGPGMTLIIRPNGYEFRSRGGSYGVAGSAIVAEDQRAAFDAFTSFQPSPEVTAHCESLKRRAVSMLENAKKVSAEALVLAGRTTLPGSCEYTKLD